MSGSSLNPDLFLLQRQVSMDQLVQRSRIAVQVVNSTKYPRAVSGQCRENSRKFNAAKSRWIYIPAACPIQTVVILGQYLGLAKLNSLNFIHLNIFEGEYLVTFRFLESKPILSFSGCNQSPPVIQYNVIIK